MATLCGAEDGVQLQSDGRAIREWALVVCGWRRTERVRASGSMEFRSTDVALFQQVAHKYEGW